MSNVREVPRRSDRAVLRVPVRDIRPNPLRPRRLFPRESIEALAESIRLHGMLNPLLARPAPDGRGLELIAGERRLLALKRLNRPWAEVILLSADDCECGILALVENLHREDMHYLDAAAACRRLLDEYPLTQERLAASLGMSPSALNNRLRLLKLPEPVREALRGANLSERHARALLRLEDAGAQLTLLRQASEQRWNVRQLESRIERLLHRAAEHPSPVAALARDNRLVVNAVLDTVRRLTRIGVPVRSRVEEQPDHTDVIITIPSGGEAQSARSGAVAGARQKSLQPPSATASSGRNPI